MPIIKISKKFISSFLKFVLLTAIIHIGVLVFEAIKNCNIKYLNYFQILGLKDLFPRIINGKISDVISISIMTIITGTFLTLSLLKKERIKQL